MIITSLNSLKPLLGQGFKQGGIAIYGERDFADTDPDVRTFFCPKPVRIRGIATKSRPLNLKSVSFEHFQLSVLFIYLTYKN